MHAAALTPELEAVLVEHRFHEQLSFMVLASWRRGPVAQVAG